MKIPMLFVSAALMAFGAFAATPLQDKIAKTYKIRTLDKWCGYDRAIIDFKGYEAWIVEPKVSAAYAKPWTWTMQWATAFPDRTGAPDMLARGWHHATIVTYKHRMDEEGIAVSREFQKYLVEGLGFNPKASLIGMSWGGFFSIRYANAHPECIRSIYLDAPLMNFNAFGKAKSKEEIVKRIGPWGQNPPADGNWSADPRMPVNMAESIAKAKLPVLLIYGGADKVVIPEENCELFIKRFKQAGGDIIVNNRPLFGHHPHGLDPTNTAQIYKFFLKHGPVAPKTDNAKSKKTLVKIEDFPLACASAETVKGEAPSLLPKGKNFKLVWNDEFDGTELDSSKWGYRTNFWGKDAHWFAKPEHGCVEVKDGKVHLKVKKLPNGQFVSPQLQTGSLIWDMPAIENNKGFWPFPKREEPKFLHKYGYYECRCRLQKMPGWWSAFWMQTPGQGATLDPAVSGIEHDIMESFTVGEVIRAAFHYNGYGADYKGFHIPEEHKDIVVGTDEFHTYGMLWEEDGYSVYIDGRLRGKSSKAVSHVPEFLLISTETKWYRNNRMTGKGVPELEDAVLAKDDFVVDYVRVYDVVK